MFLVTGAAGFIGYRMGLFLQSQGVPVIAVDEEDLFGKNPEHQDFHPTQIIDRKELLKPGVFESLLKQGLKVVYHLGACADTTESSEAVLREKNLEYSQKLWNLCGKYRIPFIYASSAATYGDGAQGYSDDEEHFHLQKPLNAYGQSKLDFDNWALQEELRGNHPPAWSGFRFFNVYGFGEGHKGRMSSVVLQGFHQIRKEGKIRLFKSHKSGIADGEQKRDFVFVDDVCRVLWFAADRPIKRGVFNLGSGVARSFKDLALATFHALSVTPQIEYIDTPLDIREKYQYFTQADLTKLRNEGCKIQMTPLEVGVARYVKKLMA